MSKKTDKYEQDVANYIHQTSDFFAIRPKVDSTYADVLVTAPNGNQSWLEVKMNHGDRLANYRATYMAGEWSCSNSDRFEPVKYFIEDQLNTSEECEALLDRVRDHYGIELDYINGEKESDFAKAFRTAKENLGLKNKNLIQWTEVKNIGKIISDQYNFGKVDGCFYLQTGDDFFMLGKSNPLGLPDDIPLFEGDGKFSMRFSDRGQSQNTVWMEIIPDFRITTVIESPYSVMPGTKKKNPFI